MGKIVAIVGRPNVGKSTLFNRLTQSRHAIVDEISGVTRDRIYGKVDWNGKVFSLIDTGGYISGSEDIFENEIRKQITIAIEEADIIVFMVDVTTGVTGLDEEVTKILRRSSKETILVANKVDNTERVPHASEFFALGMGEPYTVSAISGKGTGEILDKITSWIKDDYEEEEDHDLPRFAVVGKPNVGKSSLVNSLIGEERNIVTDIAGTTRDSINSRYTAYNLDFVLVDTAGVRKKGKVKEDLEFYSVMRTIRAIENCDVCLLLIDATEGLNAQDMNIFHLAERNQKGVVILVNKWDLVKKGTNSTKEYTQKLLKKTAPFTDVPILFISAINKQRILKALQTSVEVFNNRKSKIPTSKLNNIMLEEINLKPPPATKGKYIKIKYITQLPTHSPSFAFFCNLPQYIKEPYQRFLENKLRNHFNFTGVPMKLFFRKK
jgi:GTP-binding protein